MEDVLGKIIAHKRVEVRQQKAAVSEADMLSAAVGVARSTVSMRGSLERSASGIIAEFKRRSPSKGWIREGADVRQIVSGYRAAGAAACSVLTDCEFFGGCIDDLIAAREVASSGDVPELPLLRKEFIIDPYQILHARAAGADAVLLIAACLSVEQCAELAAAAHEAGLEVLLEIHSEDELFHINGNVDMLGVNNRNLGTFHTDINNSYRLAKTMRSRAASAERAPLLVSESGISSPETITELRKAGFKGFLMGETFMKCADPAAELFDVIRCVR